MEGNDFFLEPEVYQGEIFIDDSQIPFKANVFARSDQRLVFEVEPLEGPNPFENYLSIEKAVPPSGQPLPKASLKASSSSDKVLESDRVVCLPGKIGKTGSHITIQPQTARLKISCSSKCETPWLKMYLRGFKCFRCSPVETPLGQINIWGKVQGVSKDEVSGGILIEAPQEKDLTLWREEAEQFFDFVRKGLGLANGGRLQAPVTEFRKENNLEVDFYAGHGFQWEFPLFSPTVLQPYFTVLAKRYFQLSPIPEVLWNALSWMQAETTFDEIRFLTGMTALETINLNLPKDRINQIPKIQFIKLLNSLKETIQNFRGLDEDSTKHFKKGVGALNKKVFGEKIGLLFDHYEISRADFEDQTIREMVELRNKIIHSGMAPNEDEIWRFVILVRELITRILLKELGFEGNYNCYIGGQHQRVYPSCQPVKNK